MDNCIVNGMLHVTSKMRFIDFQELADNTVHIRANLWAYTILDWS